MTSWELWAFVVATVLVLVAVLHQLLVGPLPEPSSSYPESTYTCDVAIIGGGFSGLYSAWRLSTSSDAKLICLFEATERFGGSAWTVFLPGAPHLALELGGMRFLCGNLSRLQLITCRLFSVFGLHLVPQPPRLPGNFDFMRDTVLHPASWASEGQLPYKFSAVERAWLTSAGAGAAPSLFLDAVASAVLPLSESVRSWSDCEWDWWVGNATYRGVSLNDVALQYLLGLLNLSSEAINAVRDYAGFDSWMTLNGAIMIEQQQREKANFNSEFLRVSEGLSALADGLLARIRAHANVRVYANAQLLKNVAKGKSALLTFRNHSSGALFRVASRTVVCALPQEAVRAVVDASSAEEGGALGDADTRRALHSVGGVPLFKLFLGFDRPFWKDAGVPGGSTTTDRPPRKVYFYGTECEERGGQPGNNNSAVMFYADLADAAYLSRLYTFDCELRKDCFAPFLLAENRWVAGPLPIEPLNSTRRLLVAEAMRELTAMFAPLGVMVPEPYAAVFVHWNTSPLFPGVHIWQPGSNGPETRRLLRRASKDGPNTFVASQAFSDRQGWVEGAFRSAEKLLQERFGLGDPDWLPGLGKYVECA